MEVTFEKNIQPAKRENILQVITRRILHALTRVNSYLTMSKIDRFRAGIDTSGEGRDNS